LQQITRLHEKKFASRRKHSVVAHRDRYIRESDQPINPLPKFHKHVSPYGVLLETNRILMYPCLH